MIKDLRKALQRDEVRSISRRYFISNGFDGALTSIGITVGSYLSGVETGLTVFKVGIGAAVGLATSGVWSVWEIEKAEKMTDMHRIEEAMMKKLDGTRLHENKKDAIIINALMSGTGPIIGIVSPIIPFLFVPMISMLQATMLSIAVGTLLLFSFGAYMGDVSDQNWFRAGVRMGLAGIVVAALNIALPG